MKEKETYQEILLEDLGFKIKITGGGIMTEESLDEIEKFIRSRSVTDD